MTAEADKTIKTSKKRGVWRWLNPDRLAELLQFARRQHDDADRSKNESLRHRITHHAEAWATQQGYWADIIDLLNREIVDPQQSETEAQPGDDIADLLERRGDALSLRAARHIRIKWNTEAGLDQQLRHANERLNAQQLPVETSGVRPCSCADGARYRFLREPNNAIVYAKDRDAWGRNASGHVRYDTPEQLDAAVDAARFQVKATSQRCTCSSASGGDGPGAWASLTTDANCPVHGLPAQIRGNI